MRYRALDVFLGDQPRRRVGLLFQYGTGRSAITRLVPDGGYWNADNAPVFAQLALVADPDTRAAFLAQYAAQPFFNGEGELLPPFFQNLLPEGPLRRHLEELGQLAKDDHFGLLSLCGTDLPGAVYVRPAPLDKQSIAAVVTQHNDALEMSVVPVPVPEATSLSGVQPKLSLVQSGGSGGSGGRYVARTKDAQGVHIIAKLPTVEYPLLPQVEALSMQLAAAAGVTVCQVALAPLEHIDSEQPFVLGEGKSFLAVTRFDRGGSGGAHIHCEDFAQILGVPPEQKYTHPYATYATMLQLLLGMPALGTDAACELLRRIVVNDLLGNFDGHLKNFGLLYRDGRTPALSPAYDVVAYAAYMPGRGHALRFTAESPAHERLSPAVLRRLCNAAPGLLETKAQAVVRETVQKAFATWPGLIDAAPLLDAQKQRLLRHFEATPAVASLAKRAAAKAAKAARA